MSTAELTIQNDLLPRALSLVESLRSEGRGQEADTVQTLTTVLSSFITLDEAAQRIGLPQNVIEKWIAEDSIPSVQVDNAILIPVESLVKFDELNSILAALDEDRPPATDSEIEAALAADRQEWTWRGKES